MDFLLDARVTDRRRTERTFPKGLAVVPVEFPAARTEEDYRVWTEGVTRVRGRLHRVLRTASAALGSAALFPAWRRGLLPLDREFASTFSCRGGAGLWSLMVCDFPLLTLSSDTEDLNGRNARSLHTGLQRFVWF